MPPEPASRLAQSLQVKMEVLEVRFVELEKRVNEIRSLLRWIGVTAGGAVILAFTRFVLDGGLGGLSSP